mgnify:CR=1 FL=1
MREQGLNARTRWFYYSVFGVLLLALGGAGAVIAPALPFLPVQEPNAWLPYLLPAQTPTLPDVCVIVGFAVLIVRTRVKEG